MITRHVTAWALASALSIGVACQSVAAPAPTSNAELKSAVTDTATDVRWGGGWGWRGGGWGWRRPWWPGPVIGGLALGALVAPPYYGVPYGGPYWGGGYVGYGYPYSHGRCFTREGGGRLKPCDTN
jgi:hypothetical protein